MRYGSLDRDKTQKDEVVEHNTNVYDMVLDTQERVNTDVFAERYDAFTYKQEKFHLQSR